MGETQTNNKAEMLDTFRARRSLMDSSLSFFAGRVICYRQQIIRQGSPRLFVYLNYAHQRGSGDLVPVILARLESHMFYFPSHLWKLHLGMCMAKDSHIVKPHLGWLEKMPEDPHHCNVREFGREHETPESQETLLEVGLCLTVWYTSRVAFQSVVIYFF